jgi:hypothetical protein
VATTATATLFETPIPDGDVTVGYADVVQRWGARLAAVGLAASAAVLAARGGMDVEDAALATVGALALVLVARVRRFAGWSPAGELSVVLLLVTGVLFALLVADPDGHTLAAAAPWAALVMSGLILLAATSTGPQVRTKRLWVLLDKRTVRPVSLLVVLRISAVWADVVVDLADAETPTTKGFVDVVAVGGRVTLLFSKDLEHRVAIGPDARGMTGPADPALRVQRREYLGGRLEVRYDETGSNGA